MKRKVKYKINDKTIEREYEYIPVRYAVAVLITVLEVLAIIGIVVVLCYFVPYFYLLAWATQIACVIRIIAGDDNPDYKVPWLLFVLILPVAGFMLYFIFSSRKLKKKYLKRLHSLVHHFENGVWLYDCACLHTIKADFSETLQACVAVSEKDLKTNLFQKAFRSVVRIFAPLL